MTDVLGPAAVVSALGAARQLGDGSAALDLIAPESLDQGRLVTREDWRRKWELMSSASPDMAVTTEHTMEDGEWVAHRYTITGTQAGDLFGQPATGQRFEVVGLDMLRVRDGQVVEHWAVAGSIRPAATDD
jgi:predicted ester cyclase